MLLTLALGVESLCAVPGTDAASNKDKPDTIHVCSAIFVFESPFERQYATL